MRVAKDEVLKYKSLFSPVDDNGCHPFIHVSAHKQGACYMSTLTSWTTRDTHLPDT